MSDQKHFRRWISLAIVVIVLGIAIGTCPDRSEHKAALEERLAYGGNSGGGILGPMKSFLRKGVAKYFLSDMNVYNCVFFSIGTINDGGEEHIISVGVFGHVFPLNGR